MRSALVQTNQLAAFARLLKFENTIRLGKGETKSGGKLRNTLLCDVFEAFIGALFLDKGIEVVKDFMKPLLEVAIEEVIELHKNEDPKSQLQEWAQANGYATPKYVTKKVHWARTTPKVFEIEVKVNSKIMGEGVGKSKQSAEKSARPKSS